MKMNEEIKEILEKTPFWKYLEEKQKEMLIENSKIMEYKAGTGIYSGARECLGTF